MLPAMLLERITAGAIERDLAAVCAPSAATLRAVRRAYSKRLSYATADEVLCLGYTLLERFDRRWIAYELIRDHDEAFARLRSPQVRRLGQGMDGWGAVDAFGTTISGLAWQRGQLPDSLIQTWTRSSDLWWRRAALVSTVPLNTASHGGRGDAPRTLRVCRALIDDREDMVVKAMSWALRSLAVRTPGRVEAFLYRYDERLAARVRREVRNKLGTGLKNPRKA